MFVRVNHNGDGGVKRTSVFVNQCECVVHQRVIRQRVGGCDDVDGVVAVDTGNPQRVEVHLGQREIMFAGQMFRHPHLTLENIPIVNGDSINHLYRPGTIDWASDQTVE